MSTNTFSPKTFEDPVLQAAVTANTTNISGNDTDIASHASSILALQNSNVTQNTNISNNTGSIAAHAAALGNMLAGTTSSGLKTLITTNQADINTNTVNLVSNTSSLTNSINSNTTEIQTNASNLTALTTQTNNKFAMTATTNMKGAIDLNTAKTGITTTQANNIAANTAYLAPRNNFFYARRIKLLGALTTVNTWSIPVGESVIVWAKNIINGALAYDTSTGILTTSQTGLYAIKAKICLTTTGQERVAKIGLRVNGGTDVIIGKNHLSRHDAHNSSFSAPEIDGQVRLASGTNYEFFIECLDNSSGVVFNYQYENNDLRIVGLPLPSGYTLPPDYTLG